AGRAAKSSREAFPRPSALRDRCMGCPAVLGRVGGAQLGVGVGGRVDDCVSALWVAAGRVPAWVAGDARTGESGYDGYGRWADHNGVGPVIYASRLHLVRATGNIGDVFGGMCGGAGDG